MKEITDDMRMSGLAKAKCPLCGNLTEDVAIRFYGHCLTCEKKERENYKFEWPIEEPERKWEKLAFFHKIRGKAFEEWMKQRP